jgi:hypothetical protein
LEVSYPRGFVSEASGIADFRLYMGQEYLANPVAGGWQEVEGKVADKADK